MTFCRLSFLIALFASVAGCATSHGIVDPRTGSNTSSISTTQTGVVLGSGRECVFTEVPAEETALLSIVGATIIPEIVDQGISAIASWFEAKRKEREEKLSAVSSGRGASELYGIRGQPNFDCVMVYRGSRGEPDQFNGKWTREVQKRLGLSGPPDFFLELRVVYSHNSTAFRLSPKRLEYRKSAAVISNNVKDVLVVGVFDGIIGDQTSATGSGFGGFQISLPTLSVPSLLSDQELRGISTGWIPMPPVPPQDEKGFLVSSVPISLFVTVAESEPGNDLMLGVLGAMSRAAADSKENLSQQIADEVTKRLGLEPIKTPDDPGNDAKN